MNEHSPLPWRIYYARVNCSIKAANGDYVAENVRAMPRQEANAEFIVRACNAHDELVAALKAILEHGEEIDGAGHRFSFDYHSPMAKQARAALRKAEGVHD